MLCSFAMRNWRMISTSLYVLNLLHAFLSLDFTDFPAAYFCLGRISNLCICAVCRPRVTFLSQSSFWYYMFYIKFDTLIKHFFYVFSTLSFCFFALLMSSIHIRCSCLTMVSDVYPDIIMGHDSWRTFQNNGKIWKEMSTPLLDTCMYPCMLRRWY